jgi:hypothetical protein
VKPSRYGPMAEPLRNNLLKCEFFYRFAPKSPLARMLCTRFPEQAD